MFPWWSKEKRTAPSLTWIRMRKKKIRIHNTAMTKMREEPIFAEPTEIIQHK
jgi:hypothetical protein